MMKSGYDIKAGDKFNYGGFTYEATGDATGEFNAYVPVINEHTGLTGEIIIPHGWEVIIDQP